MTDPHSNDLENITHYSAREIISRLWPMVAPNRGKLLVIASLVLVTALAVAVVPIFAKFIIDVAIPMKDMRVVLAFAAIFLVLQSARMVFWYIARRMAIPISEELIFAMRSRGFRHLQHLCQRFHDKHPSGFLHDRVFLQSICAVGSALLDIATSFVVQFIGLVASLAICLVLSPPMTAVIFVGGISYVAVCRVMGPRIRKHTLVSNTAHNWICSYIVDHLRGMKTIQALALEEQTETDFDERVWDMQLKCIRAYVENLRLNFVSESIGYVLTSAVYVLGAYAVFHWEMTTGTLVAFIGYQATLTALVTALTARYGMIVAARAGLDQFFTVIDSQSSVPDAPTRDVPPDVRGAIRFENVIFAYAERPAIRNLSFEVPAGQTVAMVGRSGSGKTTVTNLLLRFYAPDVGRIYLDGIPIDELPLRAYRGLYGVVLQDPFLFEDTIEANLRCVKPHSDHDELRQALRKARSLDFVEAMPEGLHYHVGEGGRNLSGGQRQRIAIARCMLLDPRLLILDEATAALDNETEVAIQRSLNALFEGKTSFVIAHRLSTVRKADRILVFDEGLLVEDGTYEELLEKGGLFHRLHTIATSTSTRALKLQDAGFA